MFGAWGINSPWGTSPFGPSYQVVVTEEKLPIVGEVVESQALTCDAVVPESTIQGSISAEASVS